jgi:hypothetical protein
MKRTCATCAHWIHLDECTSLESDMSGREVELRLGACLVPVETRTGEVGHQMCSEEETCDFWQDRDHGYGIDEWSLDA